MPEVVGVKFRNNVKTFYYEPKGIKYYKGDLVIAEMDGTLECGRIVAFSDFKEVDMPLKSIVRKATNEDIEKIKRNKEKEQEALKVCLEKIKFHGIEMKLVDVECNFENNKMIFFFTADGRVDFRALVKDLASIFKMRIELRQIGVRDETRMFGGLGICGKVFCCSNFLEDFHSVSIKMAKDQGLSLNPVKISGGCGRLMCCLKYEQDAYQDLIQKTPQVGSKVNTPHGKGTVIGTYLLTQKLRIGLDDAKDAIPIVENIKDVEIIENAKLDLNDCKGLEGLKTLEI